MWGHLGREVRSGLQVQVRQSRSRRGSTCAARHRLPLPSRAFDLGGASRGGNQLGFVASNGSRSGPREGVFISVKIPYRRVALPPHPQSTHVVIITL